MLLCCISCYSSFRGSNESEQLLLCCTFCCSVVSVLTKVPRLNVAGVLSVLTKQQTPDNIQHQSPKLPNTRRSHYPTQLKRQCERIACTNCKSITGQCADQQVITLSCQRIEWHLMSKCLIVIVIIVLRSPLGQ